MLFIIFEYTGGADETSCHGGRFGVFMMVPYSVFLRSLCPLLKEN